MDTKSVLLYLYNEHSLAFVPQDNAIKMNLLLYRIFNEQIDI